MFHDPNVSTMLKRRNRLPFAESKLVRIKSSQRNSAFETPVDFSTNLAVDVNRKIRSVELESASIANVQNNVRANSNTLTFVDPAGIETVITIPFGYYLRDQLCELVKGELETNVPSSAPVTCEFQNKGLSHRMIISVNPASSGILHRLIGASGLAERLGFVTDASRSNDQFVAQESETLENPLTMIYVHSARLSQLQTNVRGDGRRSTMLASVPVKSAWGTYATYVRMLDSHPDIQAHGLNYHLEDVDISFRDERGELIDYIGTGLDNEVVLRVWF